ASGGQNEQNEKKKAQSNKANLPPGGQIEKGILCIHRPWFSNSAAQGRCAFDHHGATIKTRKNRHFQRFSML
ncbi:MAG: hypothetical protein KGZ72_09070, partial [Roseovarius sp.]|nr:hypothetical protein [Roseovarius sp.]